ncbi:hypothetical protein CLIB1423_11S03686 [[Candida] railenensis]|uniref:Uncharacterized protein n=1 Tax=[Candida] railenensis TaxID=45579 RepID=A0A9P0QRH4_9ASCO|nr:hypothetical protein CLIB1423_11S03686 [[Candida] railenensis]
MVPIPDIKSQLEDTRNDIKSLEEEIDNLSVDKKLLLDQIKKLEQGGDINNDEPLLQHKYFDEIVQDFFHDTKTNNDETNHSKKKPKISFNSLNSALVENIYRFGGITAFPINKYLFAEDNLVLGLRFDIYSINKFEVPHYIILRKEQNVKGTTQGDGMNAGTWHIFKHTLPVFIPIRQYEQEHLLQNKLIQFVKSVRIDLIKLQYRHNKFDLVSKGLGFRLEKDLQCQRVKLKYNDTELSLFCSQDYIEEVDVASNSGKRKIIESIVRNSQIKDLLKTFRRVKEEV